MDRDPPVAEYVSTAGIEMPDDAVVAVDDGWASRAALRWLQAHLPRPNASVRLVGVLDASDDRSAELPRALARLHTLADAFVAARPGTAVAVEVRDGDAVDRLLGGSARLIVIGSNRVDAESDLPFDSVSTLVAARAEVPVVVVPMPWRRVSGPIVVAVAADVPTDAAVDFAAGMAVREGRRLILVHVRDGAVSAVAGEPAAHDRLLDDAARRARRAGCGDVATVVRLGEPAEELSAAARGASLLVVGRRHRSPIARMLLGSVSRKVLGRLEQPVAVVPEPARTSPSRRLAPPGGR